MSPTRPTETELKRTILEEESRIASLDEKMELRIMKLIDDHEGRLRDVEKWQWRTMGIFMVLGALLTMGATKVVTDDIGALRQQVQLIVPAPTASAPGRR